MLNHTFELFIVIPFIGLLWIAFLTLIYLFIKLIKGDF